MRLNRKYISITAAVALLIVGALALPAMSQMRPRHGGHGQGPNLFFLMRAAQLSDTQKADVKTFAQNNRQANQPIFSQLMTLRQQLNSSLFTTGTADPTLVGQIASLQGQLEQARLNTFQQVWSKVLTDPQRSQVATAFAQFQANRAQQQNNWKSLKQQQNP
jgi:hypothetical protein